MSYSYRDKPRLSDRYRGKTGDEILNELKSQLDQDRKMFFESSPNWSSMQSPGTFSRSGFPFDDDAMPRGRQDIRSHLDDLAHRHPEFADQLRCPPWGGEMSSPRGTWGRKRRGSGSCGEDDARSQASGTSSTASDPAPQSTEHCEQEQNEEPGPLRGRTRYNHLPQYGLRNTVDLGQHQHESEQEKQGRGQRSWSAPPDSRTQPAADQPQRFVSRIDINPLNVGSSNSDAQGKPPVAPKQHLPSQQQHQNAPKQPHQGSNVRHIPIFVEGRDEPVVPKNANEPTEQVFSQRIPQHQQPSFGYTRPSQFTSHHQFQPQQSATPTTNVPPAKAKVFQQQQQQHPPSTPQHNTEHIQQKVPPQQTKPPEAPPANDPIFRVQVVQKEVDALKAKVESFSGNSRKDKDYAYLDEMLTRNLLKLDDIDTEGKDNVRQARKEVIRNIQRCISFLEAKVPSPEEPSQLMPGENATETQEEIVSMGTTSEDMTEGKGPSEVNMEVDTTLSGTNTANGETQSSGIQGSPQENIVQGVSAPSSESVTKEIGENCSVVSSETNEANSGKILQNDTEAPTEATHLMEVEQDCAIVDEETVPQVNELQNNLVGDLSKDGSRDSNLIPVSESGENCTASNDLSKIQEKFPSEPVKSSTETKSS